MISYDEVYHYLATKLFLSHALFVVQSAGFLSRRLCFLKVGYRNLVTTGDYPFSIPNVSPSLWSSWCLLQFSSRKKKREPYYRGFLSQIFIHFFNRTKNTTIVVAAKFNSRSHQSSHPANRPPPGAFSINLLFTPGVLNRLDFFRPAYDFYQDRKHWSVLFKQTNKTGI